ncbi:MAG: uroporphyrinogen-III C-methyltransferase [Gemmatimonadota bacterium]|nr:MAG: uroporphyrinogen-III C-methyltransferase [Gemmatimonadota bacterium]
MTADRHGAAWVYLVGAGPGDPGLITLRAVECLRRADVVIYDYLVNPAIVGHASPSAELISLGRPDTGRLITQDEINTQLVTAAREGRTVVRLKGGDPSVFGRVADEVAALRDAGVPYEIVPGITAGLAVGAYCEIPVTHHDDASAVALVTGHERDAKTGSALDYAALARFPGTLILYMGVKRTEEWSQALIRHGKSAATPVAAIRWATRARQEMVRCDLGSVAATAAKGRIRSPSVFVVGSAVDRAPDVSWFTARPLFGTRVLVTSTPSTAAKLRDGLAALGAEVLTGPVIRIGDPPDWSPVDQAIDRMAAYDWLVFSSANGVDYFMRRLLMRGGDVRRLGPVKVAVAGTGTAERLHDYGVRADLVPERFVAESLAEALVERDAGSRFLLAGASRGRHVLAPALERAGARVDRIVVYASSDIAEPDPVVADALAGDGIDWITVTSSASARSLVRLYGDAIRSARIVSISPVTSDELAGLGYEPAAEASPHTVSGVVDAIVESAQVGG